MQANEFVKEHGWDKAKELLAKANGCASIKSMGHHFLYSDLERLVESWEFVEEHGGFEQCKRWYKESPFKQDKYIRELKQVIADVESCQ